jgi:hypothetical protein
MRVAGRSRQAKASEQLPDELPAGWYPEPNSPMQRFWDGHQWTEHTAPFIPPPTSAETIDTTVSVPVLAGAIAMVLVVIGMVCNFQSVSLAQGSGIIWIGAALAIGGAVLAMSMPRVRTSIKVIAVIAALIGIANGIYVDKQLDHKRDQLQQIFNDIPSSVP